MFFSESVLLKKGPLAKVWLAAHWEKKMNKAQFIQTDIAASVSAMIERNQPPIALRLSGQLLLGVAKIYSRKARYLLEDCTEALVKIRMAYRPGLVDMAESTVANRNAITLPDTLTEFEVTLPVKKIESTFLEPLLMPREGERGERQISHVSDIRDITLEEEGMLELDTSILGIKEYGKARTGHEGVGEGDLVGRDDEFRFDIEEDWLMSPREPVEPHRVEHGSRLGEDSLMGIEVARRDMDRGRYDAEGRLIEGISGLEIGEKSIDTGHGGVSVLEGSELSIGGKSVLGSDLGSGIFREGIDLGSDLGIEVKEGEREAESVWEQAELDLLMPETEGENVAATKTKKRKLATTELIDEETLYPNSKIKQSMLDTTSLLSVPTYLPEVEEPSSTEYVMYSATRNMELPSAALELFEKTQLAPSDYHTTIKAPTAHSPQIVPEAPRRDVGEDIDLGIDLGIEQWNPEAVASPGKLREGSSGILQLGSDISLPKDLAEQEHPSIAEAAHQEGALDIFEGFEFREEEEEDLTNKIPLFTDSLQHGLESKNIDTQHALAALQPSSAVDDSDAPLLAAGFSKSTIGAINLLHERSAEGKVMNFNEITKDAPKSDLVKLFFEVLVLKSKDFVDVSQPEPFGDIEVIALEKLSDANSTLSNL
ncbi:Cohesin subunit rad21 [Zancudomyces culisetae]|uniref:Cohesin subunit rad21 n=1 Tax=Zancudomyces culisetae TaxID=1213189 RepID=A0A1R1PWK4_ZANCU|nr:Cohesin subunit rad21 [Zancudomyces culisetae]|eukprot:OMH85262.1 Cohesin subunit rad21 [Zancudomyces culisetae]